VQGGFFLRKKPLCIPVSVKTRIENAVAPEVRISGLFRHSCGFLCGLSIRPDPSQTDPTVTDKRSDVEPNATTDPDLEQILAELAAREPIFHRPEFGTTRADFERMTDEAFWETGASGRRYSRKFVLDELEKRHAAPHEDIWETSEFHCRRLSEDTYLLTYTLLQDKTRLTRRLTIWRKTQQGWKILYHQGTIAQNA
jgi:hypothetical protein